MCTCGCRLPAGTCGMMNCEGKAAQLGKIKTLVSAGQNREQVIATFVQDFGGQHILARPIDEGYHRLLWLLPYTLAGVTALGLAFIARRWAAGRADQPGLGVPAAAADAGLQQRLDDELRDLD
jgi:cytochrome c-type biogenesis protein CcmH/NrfF